MIYAVMHPPGTQQDMHDVHIALQITDRFLYHKKLYKDLDGKQAQSFLFVYGAHNERERKMKLAIHQRLISIKFQKTSQKINDLLFN